MKRVTGKYQGDLPVYREHASGARVKTAMFSYVGGIAANH